MATTSRIELRRALWLLLIAVTVSCAQEDVVPDAVIRPVLVHPVEHVSELRVRRFPSRAQAGTEALLSFKVAGTVEDIFVSVGQQVQAGAPIARIDDEDLVLELRQAEARFAESNARHEKARGDFRRMKILHERQAASDNQLDAAETDALSASASLEAQAQAVAIAKAQTGYAALMAPVDGRIAAIEAEVNENVRSGDPIVTLNAGGRPEVVFTVAEKLIGSLERGQPATVRFSALEGASFPAEIIEVGVSSGRTAFPVTARLLEGDPRIRSGMVAETTVRFLREGGARDNVVVPAFAVAEDAAGRFVYVAVQSGEGEAEMSLASIERRDVETAALGVEGLEISSGLKVGDLVVTAGLRFVEPGMVVRVMER